MGYTTDFSGEFKLNRPLDEKMLNYLIKFNETRRMQRKVDSKYGIDGEFYIEGTGMAGQDREDNILDYNKPPRTQPSLWCGWIPSNDGTAIVWDGGEKFYEYQEWIVYIIQNFLQPQEYVLNGAITYQGEDSHDRGTLIITNNTLYIAHRDENTLELYVTKGAKPQTEYLNEYINRVTEQKLLT
jgi:hypothetical protein